MLLQLGTAAAVAGAVGFAAMAVADSQIYQETLKVVVEKFTKNILIVTFCRLNLKSTRKTLKQS